MSQNVIYGAKSVEEVFGQFPLAIIPYTDYPVLRDYPGIQDEHEGSRILDFAVVNNTRGFSAKDSVQHGSRPRWRIMAGLLLLVLLAALVFAWYFDLAWINELFTRFFLNRS